jgi:hypothetical protein
MKFQKNAISVIRKFMKPLMIKIIDPYVMWNS